MNDSGEPSGVFSGRRVVVCVGSGGVGKTTISASLALVAAERGLRTLCLTIDPARRLAGAFGLAEFPREEAEVSREWLEANGVELAADLTVMMLDAKKTFDDLIASHCPTSAAAQAILSNRVYRHVSSRLAGVRSYMAMEKVQQLLARSDFDLIVLDTPPSSRALDFFDAPAKMIDILDSPATRALVKAMAGGGGLSLDLLALGLRRALSAFDKIVGSSLLEEMADLLAQMNVLFGGFESRAKDVGRRMRGPEFAYFLVTSPSAPALLDAASLSREMLERGLPVDQAIINRVTPAAQRQVSREQLEALPAYLDLGLSGDTADRVLLAAADCAAERTRELERIHELSAGLGALRRGPVLLPSAPSGLHQPSRLLQLGRAVLDQVASVRAP